VCVCVCVYIYIYIRTYLYGLVSSLLHTRFTAFYYYPLRSVCVCLVVVLDLDCMHFSVSYSCCMPCPWCHNFSVFFSCPSPVQQLTQTACSTSTWTVMVLPSSVLCLFFLETNCGLFRGRRTGVGGQWHDHYIQLHRGKEFREEEQE
jgi:hypothetical protein